MTNIIERQYALLTVSSQTLSPEHLTEMIGVPPDKVHRIGERTRLPMGNTYEDNVWQIRSRAGETAELEVHIQEILDRIVTAKEKIKALSHNNNVELALIIYSKSEPPLYLEKKLIDGIAALGASIDIDQYIGKSESEA